MAGWRKWVRAGAGIAGKVVGGLVIFSPVIAEKDKIVSGDLNGFANGVSYRYTGYTPSTGAFDGAQTVKGIGTVLVGIGLMKLFSIAARRF